MGSWLWQFECPYIPLLSEDDTPPFQHQWIVLEKTRYVNKNLTLIKYSGSITHKWSTKRLHIANTY